MIRWADRLAIDEQQYPARSAKVASGDDTRRKLRNSDTAAVSYLQRPYLGKEIMDAKHARLIWCGALTADY